MPRGRQTGRERNPKNEDSGYRGVVKDKRSGKWRAEIVYRNRKTVIGLYDTAAAAAHAYDKVAKEKWKDAAALNFAKTKKISRTKYPGLDKTVNARTRWDVLDYDYVDQLSEKERKWLNDFTAEYVSGNFNHTGKQFHRSKKSKRECYSRNNARNRDTQTLAKAMGSLDSFEEVASRLDKRDVNTAATEDAIIELLDVKQKINKT